MRRYEPRWSIYTPSNRLRFHPAWTPMELHEERDGKLRSGQNSTKVLWWRAGRKHLKRLQTGAYGTWTLIRMLAHKRRR